MGEWGLMVISAKYKSHLVLYLVIHFSRDTVSYNESIINMNPSWNYVPYVPAYKTIPYTRQGQYISQYYVKWPNSNIRRGRLKSFQPD